VEIELLHSRGQGWPASTAIYKVPGRFPIMWSRRAIFKLLRSRNATQVKFRITLDLLGKPRFEGVGPGDAESHFKFDATGRRREIAGSERME
jgi:hypothetical protein